jgi:L-ribulose-5-phosphate 3-epimerase
MKLIVFSKMLKEKSVEELAQLAVKLGIDGYDLCVRPEYPVNPDNAATALPEAARVLAKEGRIIGMVTGNFDLLHTDHPTAEPILGAMDAADVRYIKLGYFKYDPSAQDYWNEVDAVRRAFEGWEKMGAKHNVKICYHTHSNRCMGLNAGMLAHLIRGFDRRYIGAYLDTGHLVAEGEDFAVACGIAAEHLSLISLKDFLLQRVQKQGHGSIKCDVVEAGQGMVDWTAVFAELKRLEFGGPMSIHCEFNTPADGFLAGVEREAAFFRGMLAQVG